jgi:putative ABC transport system substrate-binding protein
MAILTDVSNPGAMPQLGEIQVAARMLGVEIVVADARRAEDIAPAFEAFKGRTDAVYVSANPFALTNVSHINTLALAARLPTIYVGKEYVQAGGLMSYGSSYPNHYRRAAEFVDKILRGAKPADLPVEQPTKFDLVVNLKTAKALGLTIPPSLLARADEVIE